MNAPQSQKKPPVGECVVVKSADSNWIGYMDAMGAWRRACNDRIICNVLDWCPVFLQKFHQVAKPARMELRQCAQLDLAREE